MSNARTILEFERTILCTMMGRPSDCWGVEVQPCHMLSQQHGEILAAIRVMQGDSRPVDGLTVSDYLESMGNEALGALALTIAGKSIPTKVPINYSRRIVDDWRKRQACDIGAALQSGEIAGDAAIESLMALHGTDQRHEFTAREAAATAAKALRETHAAGGALPGITIGLAGVDDKLGGLHNGDLIVVGGRAAMGKTAFLGGAVTAAAMAGHPVGVISGEQPADQMATRMVAAQSSVSTKSFRTAKFEEWEWPRVAQGFEAVSSLPIWFLDRSAPTLADVVRIARRWVHQHGIKALYVDYLQRIVGEGDRKHEQVGNVARGLKNLARDLNIPVLVLAQVSRGAEQRSGSVPRLGDLSDSSEIEKEADQVLMLYRAGYYDQNADQRIARVIVEKNRHGPTGYVDVAWLGETTQFRDLNHGRAA